MRKVFISAMSLAMAGALFVPFISQAEATTVATGSTISIEGKLTAMSGIVVPATLTVVTGATTYNVEVSSSTVIVRKYNGSSDLSEFMIGDTLQVRGKASNDVVNTISATRIKNLSIQRKGGTFNGSIVALDAADKTFTYKPNERVQQTVYVSSSTKITRGGTKIAFADLKAGETAKVIGLWRPSEKRIDADRIIVKMRTFSGTISSITLTSGGLPATMVVKQNKKKDITVNVGADTKLLRKYMKTATIEEFLVGDKVEVHGVTLADKSIEAWRIRNNSVFIKYQDFKGTVKSIDADAKSFVLSIISGKKSVDITVNTTDATKFRDDETAKAFSDIVVGAKLKVLGDYKNSTKTMTADRVWWRD